MKWLMYCCVALWMFATIAPVLASDVEPPHITVDGGAEASLEPDYIEWVVDIRTRDKLPSIAREVNRAIFESLLKIADKADIDEKEITSGEPAYEQSFEDGRDGPDLDRYIDTEVYRRVTLVMRDMDEFDEMLDAVHPLGVFYVVRRKSTKYEETVKRVEAAALKDARMKAVEQAAALGQNIGKAIEVDVSPHADQSSYDGGLFGLPEPIEEDDQAAGPDGKVHVRAYATVRFRLE